MGLDTVELVMEVEDAFDIAIADDAAQKILTVGDLHQYLISRVELAPAGKCLSAATFFDVKRGIQDHGIHARFGPSSKLSEILPENNRRLFWGELATTMQLKLPSLVRSAVVSNSIFAFTSVFSIIAGCLVGIETSSIGWFFTATLVVAIATFTLLQAVTRPLATHFDSDIETFRGFSERVLALNAAKQSAKHGPMGSNDLWVILREIVVEQLGVDRDEVVPTARFVEDLGLE